MESVTGELEWPRLYYDGIEHLLWNPDWIRGRQPDGTPKTVRMLMQRLRRLEAPLHHTVQLSLTLASDDFVARLVEIDPADSSRLQLTCCQEWGQVRVGGEKRKNLLDLCQPDIFVESAGVQVAIEIKATAKSSLEQVLKCAALMLVRSSKPSPGFKRKLIFLAPYDTFAEFWPRRAYADPDSLREGLRKFDDPSTDRKFRRFGTSLEEVKASLDDLQIGWKSVRDVRRDVSKELERVAAERSSGGEVYRKLLSGFERELRRWQDGD